MSIKNLAKEVSAYGRGGDSLLMHVQPHEVAGLQALAKSQGTSLTINPETGLPEAFSLGGFFNSLLPVLAGAATGGAGAPLWAGIAAGAATGAVTNRKDPLMGAVTGGLGGYGGFNLGQGFAGAGAGATAPAAGGVQLAGSAAAPTGAGVQLGTTAANQIPAGALDRALAQSAVNFDPIAKQTAQNIVANTGPGVAFKNTFAQSTLPGDVGYLGQGLSGKELMSSGAIGSASPGGAYSAQQGLQNMGQGFQNVVTGQEGAWDAFKQGLAGAGKAPVSNLSAAGSLAMPLGGAVLSGLEPSDIYGEPMKPDTRGRYDPYASLNLSGDTGLRLYAAGGPVSFADGGDAMKGGGTDTMQGAGMLPLDVSDINAKYGYNAYDPSGSGLPRGMQGNTNTAFSGRNGGIGNIMGAANTALGSPIHTMPNIEPPKLGLFADNDQIEAARSAYETQLAAAMAGRGGMGSTPNARQVGQAAGQSAGPMGMQTTTSGIGGLGSTAKTADTAPTAETALSRLNLNKTYANGGTVQTGGIQDLYATSDNPTMNPSLSRDGYGLGRLQQLADGGVAGYANGGNIRTSYGGVGENGITSYITGGPQHRAIINSLADTFGKNTDPSNEFGTLVRRIRDYNYPTSTPSLNGRGAEAMQGGNLNLNTASGLGMAKGGYLDGPGDGMSDSIPATIEGKQPARLADGEFVIPADVVSHLGNGSTKAGSQRLYGMLDKVRKARTGTKKQGKQIKPEKYMPA